MLGHEVENFPENHLKPSREMLMLCVCNGAPLGSNRQVVRDFAQHQPELEARCFGMGIGTEASLALGPSEPRTGDLAFPENRDLLPLSSHSCPEALGLPGKALMPQQDIPARTPVTPVPRDSVRMG